MTGNMCGERTNSYEMFVYLYICIGMLLFLCRDNAVAAKSFGKFESYVIAIKCSYIRKLNESQKHCLPTWFQFF